MKRSKWKGLFTGLKNKAAVQIKISRNSSIIPICTGKTFQAHNGKTFKNVTVSKEMLGHKFGEFVKTRAHFEYKKKKKKKKKNLYY